MTALGINVSTRDNLSEGWTALYKHSRRQTRLESEHREAKEKAEALWQEHTRTADEYEYRLEKLAETDPVEYDKLKSYYLMVLAEVEEKALIAEHEQHRLYQQINCNHVIDDYPNGPDDVTLICRKCGLRF